MIRRSGRLVICVSLIVLWFSVPALSQNYVRFTDGRYLAVEKVVVHQEIIELDLGNRSRMFLPYGQVEWFNNNGKRQLLPMVAAQHVSKNKLKLEQAVRPEREEIPTQLQYTNPEHNYGVYLAAQADRLRRGRNASQTSQ